MIMGKLRLGMEELRVESFTTSDARAEKGTVRGHSEPSYVFTECACRYTEDVGWHYTCYWSCVDEMGATVCAEVDACTADC
jgi:hypothetical protein